MRTSSVMILVGSLAAGLNAAGAQAGDPQSLNPQSPWYLSGQPNGWYFDAGIGIDHEPTYAGADESMTEPGLAARVTYVTNDGAARYFLSLGALGAAVSLGRNTQLSGFLEYEEAREADDDDALIGLDPVDSTIEGQFILAHRLGNWMLFGILQPDVTGDANKGLVYFAGVGYDHDTQGRWRWSTRLDISGANSEYMQTEFGINGQESLRTGYTAYDPGAGLKSATWGISAEYYINDYLSVLGILDAEYYFTKASDSPLIKDQGSKTTAEASLLLRFRF